MIRPAAAGAVTAFVLSMLAPPDARASQLAVSVDGRTLAAFALARGGELTLVPLEALATAAGWRVERLAAGARLSGDDRSVVVTVGSRSMHEGAEIRYLSSAAVMRSGRLYVATADAARLLGLQAHGERAQIAFRHPQDLGSAAQIVEIARPATPAPRATHAARRLVDDAEPPQQNGAGRIVVSLDRVGRARMLQLTGETHAPYFQTTLDASGIDRFGTVNAAVSLGTDAKRVDLGLLRDPLSGLTFAGGAYQGIEAHRAALHADAFAGHRYEDGTSLAGVTTGDTQANGADTLAVVTHDGSYRETVLRRAWMRRRPWGDVRTELIASDRGAGVGLGVRTAGRTFVESALTYAMPGLASGPNDAPLRIDVGRNLSDATTLVGGFATTPHQPLGPFVGLSTRLRDVLASVSASEGRVTTSLGYQFAGGNLQFSSVPGPQRTVGAQAAMALRRAVVEFVASSSRGSRDVSLLARTTHRGLNVVGGVGANGGGRLGAIAGLAVPVGSLAALEGTVRPSGNGTALRLSLALAVPSQHAPRATMLPAEITLSGGSSAGARLFVDGIPTGQLDAATTAVSVARGSHTFAVESADGRFGSPEVAAAIDLARTPVSLPMWPIRSVAGRVALADPRAADADVSLAGIVIVLGDASTETAADGTFVFAKRPVPSDATLAVDPSTVPRGLRAADAPSVANGDTVIVLQPARRIERRRF